MPANVSLVSPVICVNLISWGFSFIFLFATLWFLWAPESIETVFYSLVLLIEVLNLMCSYDRTLETVCVFALMSIEFHLVKCWVFVWKGTHSMFCLFPLLISLMLSAVYKNIFSSLLKFKLYLHPILLLTSTRSVSIAWKKADSRQVSLSMAAFFPNKGFGAGSELSWLKLGYLNPCTIF